MQCEVTDKRRSSIEKGSLEVPCELTFSLMEWKQLTVVKQFCQNLRNYLPNSVLTNSAIIT